MPCYHPITGYRARERNDSGKYSVVFNPTQGYVDLPMTIPCGQCIGCRLERSRQWAIRCMHEASLYDSNCFITLTYDNEHLPEDGSLDVSHFQKFMKRLRKKFGSGIRFFHCGEYGDKFARPHYHACIFNFDFPDKVLFKSSRDVKLYVSAELQKLWSFGFSTVGDVTFESAAYVARYITKKVNGKDADKHYCGRKPEYITMSRRPGIAAGWFDKFKDDIYPSDSVIVRGKKCRPPKFYDGLYEIVSPSDFSFLKIRRKYNALKFKDDCTPERLDVRERVKLANFSKLIRGYESDL